MGSSRDLLGLDLPWPSGSNPPKVLPEFDANQYTAVASKPSVFERKQQELQGRTTAGSDSQTSIRPG